MKGKKLTLLIAGIVLFLAGLIWMLVSQGFWLNWLILVVGVVLFVLSFIGKKEVLVAPAAPQMPAEAAPEVPTEEAPKKKN